ncbi:hypothetical protein PWG71_01030 [Nocardiopsis sp. N85]|uniref:hypothetical protein n=1 Tax=Nocardiopsis sp. N85 TaxID=3029400 RepID=UPI00237F2990|nr:hypothetical protein [Nocardiopsis sp. N85]MDE3719953.1 hypothetical protein [Nocardiopsis sp. N85]
MANAWMPEAERIDGGDAHASRGIGAPRAVWTVTGADPDAWSAREEAVRLIAEGRTVHLVWNPSSGRIAQILPATRRGTPTVGATHVYGSHVDHGDEGRVCLVVAVVGHTGEPFTEGPMRGLAAVLDWLDSWGVRRDWPAGPPGVDLPIEVRAREWARGGHFGHDQVPGSTDPGPGRLDTVPLLATGGHRRDRHPELAPSATV